MNKQLRLSVLLLAILLTVLTACGETYTPVTPDNALSALAVKVFEGDADPTLGTAEDERLAVAIGSRAFYAYLSAGGSLVVICFDIDADGVFNYNCSLVYTEADFTGGSVTDRWVYARNMDAVVTLAMSGEEPSAIGAQPAYSEHFTVRMGGEIYHLALVYATSAR